MGKPKYVVAENVLALNPFVKKVEPDTVPPVKLDPVEPVKLTPKFGYVPLISIFVPPVIVTVWSGAELVIVTLPSVIEVEIPTPFVTPLIGKFK